MILIYPLLLASNINPNVIPGVVKALERYLIIYQLDHIVQASRELAGIHLQQKGKHLIVVKEDVEEAISSFLSREMLLEQPTPKPTTKNQPQPRPQTSGGDSQNYPDPSRERDDGRRDASVSLDRLANDKTLSLEPTWIKVDRQAPPAKGVSGPSVRYSDVIGIKVLPVVVKSDAKLVHLLTYDANVKKITRKLITFGRSAEVFIGRIADRLKGYLHTLTLGLAGKKYGVDKPVTGDPYKDVIMKRTHWAFRSAETKALDSIFVMTNLADFKDSFFQNPKKMMDLRKMGWGSIIVADDVNKRVSFCMKPFSGMCSNMPYSVLFQSFDQYDVYKDLEEVKRSASSIFKIGAMPIHKMLGESNALRKIDEFSADSFPKKRRRTPIMEEAEILGENLFTLARKTENMGISTFKAYFRMLVNDPDKYASGVFGSEKFIMKMARRIDPKFIQGYEFSKRVYKNTIRDVDTKILDKLAFFTTVFSSVTQAGVKMDKLREIILEIVRKYRERRKRRIMSGERMPEEYVGSFYAGAFLVVFMLVSVFTILYFSIIGYENMENIRDAVKDSEEYKEFMKKMDAVWQFLKKIIAQIIPEPVVSSIKQIFYESIELINTFKLETMTVFQKVLLFFLSVWSIKTILSFGKKPKTYDEDEPQSKTYVLGGGKKE